MRIFLVSLLLCFYSGLACADMMNQVDAGIFQLLRRDHLPTDIYFRLAHRDNRWVLERKEAGGQWKEMECDNECQIRNATADEINAYFPQQAKSGAEIACQQNNLHAICSVLPAENPKAKKYFLLDLGNGKRQAPLLRQLIRVAIISDDGIVAR